MIKVYDENVLKMDFEKPIYVRDVSSITEQAGYVDAQTQITRLMNAGVNLVNFRREFYDYPDGNVPDNAKPDPTMKVGFDPVDADMIMSQLNEKASRKRSVTVEGVDKGETEESVPSVDK